MWSVAIVWAVLGVAVSSSANLTDGRDGATYRTVRIGGRTWMAENLRYPAPGSTCYESRQEHCVRLGRLFDFAGALVACPDGWRLPSDSDWMLAEMALGASPQEAAKDRARADGVGDRMKVGGISGFDAVFAGYFDPHHKAYRHAGRTAAFWTSTSDGADDVSTLAWHRDVDVRRTGVYRSKVNTTYKLSVRCVAD